MDGIMGSELAGDNNMRKVLSRCFLVASILIAGALVIWVYNHFYRDHVTYEKQDTRTGLKLVVSCQYSESSFRTYVTLRSPAGRVISRNEIPFSADQLSDCTRSQYYAVADLVLDPAFNKLSVHFADARRSPVEVPLLLDGIDLPNSPRPPLERTAR